MKRDTLWKMVAGAGVLAAVAVAAVLVAVFAFDGDDKKATPSPTPSTRGPSLNNVGKATPRSSSGTSLQPSLSVGANISANGNLYDPATVGFGALGNTPSQSAAGSLSASPNTAGQELMPSYLSQAEVSFGTIDSVEAKSSRSGLGAVSSAAPTALQPATFSQADISFGNLGRVGVSAAPASPTSQLFAQSFLGLSANATSSAGLYSPAEVSFGSLSSDEPLAVSSGRTLTPNTAGGSLQASAYSATELNFGGLEAVEATVAPSTTTLSPSTAGQAVPLKPSPYSVSAAEGSLGSLGSAVPGTAEATSLTGSLNSAAAGGYGSGQSSQSDSTRAASAKFGMFLCGTFNGKQCVPAFRGGRVPASSRSLTFVVSYQGAKGQAIQLGIGDPARKVIVTKTKPYVAQYTNGVVWWPTQGPFRPQRIDAVLIVNGKAVGVLPVTIA